MNEKGKWVTIAGRRVFIKDKNSELKKAVADNLNSKERIKKQIRKKEKELKENEKYLEYLYSSISRPARTRKTFMRKTNFVADEIVRLEKEIEELKNQI